LTNKDEYYTYTTDRDVRGWNEFRYADTDPIPVMFLQENINKSHH